jgi:preprotein translocase SecE subunit
MAIVRTTPKETASGEPVNNGPSAPAARDTTRSVVRQAPARAAQPRVPGAARQQAMRQQTQGGESPLNVQDTMTELRRVVWPTREKVQAGTIVTIGLLVFFGAYIFGLDSIINALFHALNLYPQATPGS